jgi:hypothetical protein
MIRINYWFAYVQQVTKIQDLLFELGVKYNKCRDKRAALIAKLQIRQSEDCDKGKLDEDSTIEVEESDRDPYDDMTVSNMLSDYCRVVDKMHVCCSQYTDLQRLASVMKLAVKKNENIIGLRDLIRNRLSDKEVSYLADTN